MWKVAAVILVVAGLGVLATLLLRNDRAPSAGAPSTGPVASASPTATPSASASASTRPASPTRSAASRPRIETSSTSYFGTPFETVHIPGRYVGGSGSRELRLQLRRSSEWTSFPLPVVTRPSGRFRAYVELAEGEYRLRVVDPRTGTASEVLTLLVF